MQVRDREKLIIKIVKKKKKHTKRVMIRLKQIEASVNRYSTEKKNLEYKKKMKIDSYLAARAVFSFRLRRGFRKVKKI